MPILAFQKQIAKILMNAGITLGYWFYHTHLCSLRGIMNVIEFPKMDGVPNA
jgi:hypothetical protein